MLYVTRTKNWKNGSSTPVYGPSADTDASDLELRRVYGWADPLGSGPREAQQVRTEQWGTSGSQTTYDDEGHILAVSFSKYSGSGGSYGSINERFYRFGRVSRVTTSYDLLGRLASICPLAR